MRRSPAGRHDRRLRRGDRHPGRQQLRALVDGAARLRFGPYGTPVSTPRRRSPLPPILLVLVPLSLLQTLYGLLPVPGTDPARVINGMLVLSPAQGVEALVVAVAWTWAVTAGVAALGGADRPLRRALRLLPTVCGALFAAIGAVLVAFLLLGLLLPAAVEVVWVVGALLAVPVAVLLVRLALVLPIAVFENLRGMAAFRTAASGVGQYMVSIAILLLLGVLGPAVLTGWAWEQTEPLVDGHLPGLGLRLARDVALVLLAALQAGTLVVAYRNLPQPRLTVVSSFGAEGHAQRRTLLVLGLAAVLLPTLVAGGVVATRRLPELSVQPRADYGSLVALSWPAGRHPVLLTQHAVEDCLDDECRATRRTELPSGGLEDAEGAAIAADGSVYALTVDRLAYCDPQRTCRTSGGLFKALGWPRQGAIALAPDGEILIAVAAPRADPPQREGRLRREDTELRLIRCRDFRCAEPTIRRLGLVQGLFDDEYSDYYRELLVGVDLTGRPVVAYRPRGGSRVWVARCDTPTCASPQLAIQANPAPLGLPTEDELASLHFDRLVHPCDLCTGALSATVERPGGGIYGVAITHGEPGVRVQIGEPIPAPRRAVLWTCADYRCRSPLEIPLIEAPEWSGNFPGPSPGDAFLLAADPDGRVIVARKRSPEHIVTVRP